MKLSEAKMVIDEIGRDAFEEHGGSLIEAALNCNINPEDIAEAYCGKFFDDINFVQDILDERVCDLPPYIYIDWERTARLVMMDYCEHDGYYFRNL